MMMAGTRPFGIDGRHRPAAGPPGTGGLGVVIRCPHATPGGPDSRAQRRQRLDPARSGRGRPWPGVLMFPDAGGPRETSGQMGHRLAGPDVRPDQGTDQRADRGRRRGLGGPPARSAGGERIRNRHRRYCLGWRMSMVATGGLGITIAAVASRSTCGSCLARCARAATMVRRAFGSTGGG